MICQPPRDLRQVWDFGESLERHGAFMTAGNVDMYRDCTVETTKLDLIDCVRQGYSPEVASVRYLGCCTLRNQSCLRLKDVNASHGAGNEKSICQGSHTTIEIKSLNHPFATQLQKCAIKLWNELLSMFCALLSIKVSTNTGNLVLVEEHFIAKIGELHNYPFEGYTHLV